MIGGKNNSGNASETVNLSRRVNNPFFIKRDIVTTDDDF
jgi:hypothetical protein